MEYFIICLAAFLTSILTFFSGFGLGTILTPIFALFFPIDLAIALTGVVHFLNNLFKVGLVGKHANKTVLLKFGIPAVLAAFIGAWVLVNISGLDNWFTYDFMGRVFEVTPVKVIISVVLIAFSIFELTKTFKKLSFDKNKLPVGGILSGFFGGLSGHQGALRSAFLIKVGLSKEAFIGTGVIIACFIDFTRLSVYASRFSTSGLNENMLLVILATLSAMIGAIIGNKLLKKVTLDYLHTFVAITLIVISIALGIGLI
ncbi:MAG: sulfite exporter TauE/SafE family protein [bacterium]|nr:sulfite exporter TauE/SafE family protein [bacterium]